MHATLTVPVPSGGIRKTFPAEHCIWFTYVTNQQMHIYKYVQSHIIIQHQHISVTLCVTITRVSYNKDTINICNCICIIKHADDGHGGDETCCRIIICE